MGGRQQTPSPVIGRFTATWNHWIAHLALMLQSDHNPANAGISKPGKTSHRKPKLWCLRRHFRLQTWISPTQKTLNSAAPHLADLNTNPDLFIRRLQTAFATPPDKPKFLCAFRLPTAPGQSLSTFFTHAGRG
ncbi:hypothetical protein PG996_009387 [Apiospora saccharicola]|uniref:Uncharacterized protein n=1 Tax=Apiospora saccharicola TaxID=335842 RepID=A0ABR1UKM4_9PEZI